MPDSSTIEIHQVKRFRTSDDALYYDVKYTNPQNGKPHAHRIGAEAVGTRMELFGLTREETLELIISEAHSLSDDVNFMYQTAIQNKRQALKEMYRESRALRRPWQKRLDAELSAFVETTADRASVDHVRKYCSVVSGAGWDEMVAHMDTDQEEIDLHAAWYIASHIVTVETQEGRV